MRVLLLTSPKIQHDFHQIARMSNLGIVSLAGAVKDICDVKVADLQLFGGFNDECIRFVKDTLEDYKPDIIGLSSMTFQYFDSIGVALSIRAYRPEAEIVLGGYHCTLTHETVSPLPFDYLVRGEGEGTFRELILALQGNGEVEGIKGLSYKKDGTFVHNPSRPLLDPSEIKLPARGSRLITKGLTLFGNSIDAAETSRGCLMGCRFCSIQGMYGKTFRPFPMERVISDIKAIKKRGTKAVFFADDNINLRPKHFETVCDAIIDAGLTGVQYYTQMGVNGITPHLATKMKKAGFKMVFLGIESSSQRDLNFVGKKITTLKSAKAVANLHNAGIGVVGGTISGNPDDTREDVISNYEFMKELKVEIPIFYIMQPYPGTAIRDELLDSDLITNKYDWSKYDGLCANVKTKYLSSEELQRLVWELASSYYTSLKFINRQYQMLKGINRWWFAKQTAKVGLKYAVRRLKLRFGRMTVEDAFREDCRNRSFHFGGIRLMPHT